MRVKAIAMGYYPKGKSGARVKPGTVLEVPEGTKGKWFKPLDSEDQADSGANKNRQRKEKE